MISPNRRTRRSAKRMVAAAGAAVATTALTMGVSAPVATPATVSNANIALAAKAIDITAVTSGIVMGLASALGYDSFSVTVPIIGDINLKLNNVSQDPSNIYNGVNQASPMKPGSDWGIFCQNAAVSDNCRLTPIIATEFGNFSAYNAIRDLGLSVLGNSLLPLSPILAPGQTLSPLISALNVLRPNGGLATRFPGLFGVDTSLMPFGQKTAPTPSSTDPVTTAFTSDLIDVGFEYNPFNDFPVVGNPFALFNSAMAVIPPINDLLPFGLDTFNKFYATIVSDTGVSNTLPPGDSSAFGAILQTLTGGGIFPQIYLTLPAKKVPLLAPLAWPADIANSLLTAIKSPYLLGNPVGDILTPPTKILVNIGYPDVVTPTDIANNPVLAKFPAYDRIFSQTGVQTAFGSVDPLTPEEMRKVPGDVFNAFGDAVKAEIAKPFWGILVPAPTPPPTPTPPSANTVEPVPAAAVNASAALEDPEPVAIEPASEPDSVSDDSAPAAGNARHDNNNTGGYRSAGRAHRSGRG